MCVLSERFVHNELLGALTTELIDLRFDLKTSVFYIEEKKARSARKGVDFFGADSCRVAAYTSTSR